MIEHRRGVGGQNPSELDYLSESSSHRIGALDFQHTSEKYTERRAHQSTLEMLTRGAEAIEAGAPLTPDLAEALLHGTSVGGARPKVLLDDGGAGAIAKFSSTSDSYPVVRAEFVAMTLAAHVGLSVAPVALTEANGKDVLLVTRFDRDASGKRMLVSALTLLDLHDADGMVGRYATHTALADVICTRFTHPRETLRELFERIVFNVLVGNTDDHARNHAGFWDGRELALTPAYDICPQPRLGEEAAQAMAYGRNGERRSSAADVIRCARHYHVDTDAARAIVERQVEMIRSLWDEVCEVGRMTSAERSGLWGRQILNPAALRDG